MSMEPRVAYHKDNKKYYISRLVDPTDDFGVQYMQRDGKWHLWCGDNNYFKTEAEAEKFLNKHKDTATMVTGEMLTLEEELVDTTRNGIETITNALVAEMKFSILKRALCQWYIDPSTKNRKALEDIASYYTEKVVEEAMKQSKDLH